MDSAAGPMELVAALLRGVTPAELVGGAAAGERGAKLRALLATLAVAVLGCVLLVLWRRTAAGKKRREAAEKGVGRSKEKEETGDDGRKRVAVFFGTQTGTVEEFAKLVIHPHNNIFLLKTNLLQLITDMISDSSTEAIVQSRAALISGRLLSSADAFVTIDKSCVSNLLLVIDGILKIEGGQNTDEIESALEAIGLIGATNQGACLLLTDSSNVARHVVEISFDRQGRGKQLRRKWANWLIVALNTIGLEALNTIGLEAGC